MDNLDTILFICSFTLAVLAALLVFHVVGLAWVWWRERMYIKRRFRGVVPWWWRSK